MQKLVGIIFLVVGVLLIVAGYDAAHEVGAKLRYVFSGSIPDRPKYLMLAGAFLGVIGILQIFAAKR